VVKVRIAKPYRLWIYSVFALIWASGVTFFVLSTWFQIEGDYGVQKHPFEFTALQIHGFAAFIMMVTYGYFLGTHVQAAWKVKPKRTFGVMLMIMPVFLMITAYLLYYIAQDVARQIIAYMHAGVGFFLPFILISHVLRNRKKKKKKKSKSKSKS
tara:strand:- start:334 stop:798 length:465 start_codon:yes stop_codon:yes gene_type:complete